MLRASRRRSRGRKPSPVLIRACRRHVVGCQVQLLVGFAVCVAAMVPAQVPPSHICPVDATVPGRVAQRDQGGSSTARASFRQHGLPT